MNLKRIIAAAIAATTLPFFALAATALVATETIDGIKWTYYVTEGNAIISGISSSTAGAITIPSTLGGYPVTSIGRNAFEQCSNLTSVTIPDSVTNIGSYAFSGCRSLTSVTMHSSVTSIAEGTFSGCSGLTSVTIPDSVTNIGGYAFYDCSSLTSVTIPNSVTNIGNKAFSGSGLTTPIISGMTVWFVPQTVSGSFAIPQGVTCIAPSAFYGCGRLTSVSFPESVTNIGNSAFMRSGLTSISIGSGVTSIGTEAFCQCAQLKSVVLPQGITTIDTSTFQECSSLTSITIPKGVTTIGGYAFRDCGVLSSVTIPSSVTGIGWGAFMSCSSLATLTVPSSVTVIGYYAFGFGVGNVTYYGPATGSPWGASTVNGFVDGDWVYEDAAKTRVAKYSGNASSVTIPRGVKNIGYQAFYACGFSSISIPNTVTNIEDEAFRQCRQLTSVSIPSSISSIGFNTFLDCTSLKSVTIPSSVRSIGNSAFAFTGLTSVTIPYGVLDIDCSFNNCQDLAYVSIANSVTNIGYAAFMSCKKLSSVTIPNSVKSIGDLAFYDCRDLTSVSIGSGVTSIGYWAFVNCTNLCETRINVSDMARWATNSINSQLAGRRRLFANGAEITNLVIPDGVKNIGSYAFSNCSGITSVAIPDSVTNIGGYAFYDCSGLKSITIPDSVTNIGTFSFSGCDGLTSVTIPDSMTNIGDYAFSNCKNLQTIYLPLSYSGNAELGVGSGAIVRYVVVSLNAGEGSFPANAESSFWITNSTYGDKIDSTIPLPASEEVVFGGWSLYGQTITGQSDITVTTNHVLTATWKLSDPIPPLAANATASEVTNTIASAGFVPSVAETLQDAIDGDAAKYNEFRDWAQAVKDSDGEVAGEATVVASERAAISYLLGTDTLIADGIESEDVHITGFSIDHGAESGGGEMQFSFEVAIDGVEIGSSGAIALASQKENLKKAIGIEGSTRLDGEFSSENIELTFDAPVDGKARFTATPPPDAGESFFMRANVK